MFFIFVLIMVCATMGVWTTFDIVDTWATMKTFVVIM